MSGPLAAPPLPRSVALYAQTIGRMQPRQIVGVADRKLRERIVPRLPIDFDHRYEDRVPDRPTTRTDHVADNLNLLRECLDEESRRSHRSAAFEAAEGSPSFLNRTLEIDDGQGIDWYDDRLDDRPRLWRLKLYGFQPLSDLVRGFAPDDEEARAPRRRLDGWIEDWLDDIRIGNERYLRRAWTPYAVSLRLRNWIRYASWLDRRGSGRRDGSVVRAELAREIYKNALFLGAHVERDVGGNHLVENGAALVAAGLFFPDADHEFVRLGRSILAEAGADQFLTDGCHEERSPMYHVLCLTRLLTARDLLRRADRAVPRGLTVAAERATAFLRYLRPPDGRLPLLNDAVRGQSLSLTECLRYADAVGVTGTRAAEHPGPAASAPTDRSGYHWLRSDAGAMLVDGGAVGPPHLPGHAHSDLLSVLLWIDGRPVLTDTGTFDYEGGDRRRYARGVAGHNTVQVNGTEPIALGGRFLMGDRPVPETRCERGPVSSFEGRYRASPVEGAEYVHHRTVFCGDAWWLLWDVVSGTGRLRVRNRLHLHPDVDVSGRSNDRLALDLGESSTASVHPVAGERASVERGPYFPEFGVAIDRPVIELETHGGGADAVASGALVHAGAVDEDAVSVATDGRAPTALVVDGDRQSLPDRQLRPR